MPAAHHRGDRAGSAEAEPRQRRQCLRVVLGAGEHEIAGTGEARRLLEQLGIMPLDRAEPGAQFGDEVIGVLIAEKRRDSRDPGAVGGRRWVCASSTICSRCSTRRRKR